MIFKLSNNVFVQLQTYIQLVYAMYGHSHVVEVNGFSQQLTPNRMLKGFI